MPYRRSSSVEDIKADEDLTEEDLQFPASRMEYWDQLHPTKGRFRRVSYQDCQGWEMVHERHLHRDSPNSAALTWRTWIAGVYKISYPSKDKPLAEVEIEFDWAKKLKNHIEAEYNWKITVNSTETDSPAVAYLGSHQGTIRHTSQREYYEIKWNIPIFSPFVLLNSPTEWESNGLFTVGGPAGAVIGGSEALSKSEPTETIEFVETGPQFGLRKRTVLVIERVMRSLCAFLVFGPVYSTIPEAQKPKVRHVGKGSDYNHITKDFFKKTVEFSKAASFFCRAYVPQAWEDDLRKVTAAEKNTTIESVVAMLEHHTILQEPFWIEDVKWAENLESEVQSVETLKEWRSMDKKWATLTSFACGLRLHEGPWAGEEWAKFSIKED